MKLIPYGVRAENRSNVCQVTMSGRVGATTGVKLASDSFLAVKVEAFMLMGRHVVTSRSQS